MLVSFHGGEGGIRTLGTLAGTHDFESCAFDHSATSPWVGSGANVSCNYYDGQRESLLTYSIKFA